jgi:hypothetical protein
MLTYKDFIYATFKHNLTSRTRLMGTPKSMRIFYNISILTEISE